MMTHFEKVSERQFNKDWQKVFGVAPGGNVYASIVLPRRATRYDAGYDFFAPVDVTLGPGETILIPTGIRAIMDFDQFLMLVPRSGLGFKFRMQFDNTVGIVDSQYSKSDNEGHIMAKITNDTKEFRTCRLERGQAFMQGILLHYDTMDDEDATTKERNGGFGSTDADN